MVTGELEDRRPDRTVGLKDLLERTRAKVGVNRQVQGQVQEPLIDFLIVARCTKSSIAKADRVCRALHIDVNRWGRRVGLSVQELGAKVAVVPRLPGLLPTCRIGNTSGRYRLKIPAGCGSAHRHDFDARVPEKGGHRGGRISN
eukprot:s7754_g3.t1